MIVQLVLHIRPAPGGRVVVTPIEFPTLARDARNAENAIAELRPRLLREIKKRSASDRAALVDTGSPELVRVPVQLRPEPDSEPVAIVLGAVVIARTFGDSSLYVVRFPALPGHQSAYNDRAKAIGQLTRQAERALRHTSPAQLASVNESAGSRLITIDLELPDVAEPEEEDKEEEKEDGFLAQRGQELTAADAQRDRLDLRDDVVERVLATLAGPGKSSVLLVGPSDVGKSTIVQEVAARLATGAVPEQLRGRKLWRLSANEIVAGARYTGMWQDQFRSVIQELRKSRAICAMENPQGIIDAGQHAASDNNAARLLRPYVESGEITLICDATPEQIASARLEEPGFIAAFHQIEVAEPTREVARQIAGAEASRIATTHGVEITADALDASMELTRRFVGHGSYPGNVVRLIKQAVRDRMEGADRIDRAEITRLFARQSGLPLALLSDEVPLNIAQLREHFEGRVLGQSDATAAMIDLITTVKAGLSATGKPLGSFLFIGPTGVGKTEMAKALAEFIFGSRDRVVRLDMGEYASSDAPAKLLGSGWRNESGGELTRRIQEQPFSVVLLDEIEKAHPTVFDALLALLGEGRLTDGAGRTTNFESTIVLMTSNLGADATRGAALGFAAGGGDPRTRLSRYYIDAAQRFFRPEFVNRLDRIVVFHELDEAVVQQIARRDLGKLFIRDGIVRRRLLIEVDDAVVSALAKRGMDPKYGARPLQREIEREVIHPLARLIVERSPQPGSLLRIHLTADEISLDLAPIKDEPESKPPVRVARRIAQEERTFAKAVALTAALDARLGEEEASPALTALRGEASALITTTHDPTFWDDNAAARRTLSRIYELEHVLGRFDELRRRAAGLCELARQLSAARSPERLSEVWSALEEIDDRLAVVRLEIGGAVAGAGGRGALVTVTAVGADAAPWATELFEMYCSWAERTARQITRLDDRRNAARIDGLSTFDLLRGESGLHRRIHPDHTVSLARVAVKPLDGDAGGNGFDERSVVRVYEEGRRQLVRDTRTGTKETKVDAVLREGKIDEFLLAWLRLQRDLATPPSP